MVKKITTWFLMFVVTLGIIASYPVKEALAEEVGISLSKIIFRSSSFGEVNKEISDPNFDISNIRTAADWLTSKPMIKLVFSDTIISDYVDRKLDDTTIIRVYDKDKNCIKNKFKATYNQEDKSFSIFFKDMDGLPEKQNPYYIALTKEIKSDQKTFELKNVFGGRVNDEGSALMLPFIFDTNPPKYTVKTEGVDLSADEANPSAIAKNCEVEFKFDEKMSFLPKSKLSDFITLQDKDTKTKVVIDSSEYSINENSIKFKISESKFLTDKVYSIKISSLTKDISGLSISSEIPRTFYFRLVGKVIKDSTIEPIEIQYLKGSAKDIDIKLNLNGNKLDNIKAGEVNLVDGKDYVIGSDCVKINGTYLETLNQDTNVTFDFSEGKDAILKVIIKRDGIISLKKIVYTSSSLNDEKSAKEREITDTTTDISSIITKSEWSDSVPIVKFVLSDGVLSDYKDTKLDDKSAIRVFDKNQQPITAFSATYNASENSFSIFQSDIMWEAKNGLYYIALTDDIKSDKAQFKVEDAFGGKVSNDRKLLLLPFNFDSERPTAEVTSSGGAISTNVDAPTVLNISDKVLIKFSENMRTYSYKLDEKYSSGISIKKKNDSGVFEKIDLGKDDHEDKTSSVELFLNNIKYEPGKDYCLELSTTYLKDIVGLSLEMDDNKFYFRIKAADVILDTTVSPTSVEFNKKSPVDVEVTMNLNGNKLLTIKNGAETLANTDYQTDGSKLTIKSSYLEKQAVGDIKLILEFDKGKAAELSVKIKDEVTTGEKDSYILPVSVEFDKAAAKNIDIAMTLNGNKLLKISSEIETLKEGIDYTVKAETVTINSSYLNKQTVKKLNLTFDFDKGKDGVLVVSIKEIEVAKDSEITPMVESYDKINPKKISIVMLFRGNKLKEIQNGDKTLIQDKDYVLSGSNVDFSNDYLVTLKNGENKLVFIFDKGKSATLTLNVTEKIVDSQISPYSMIDYFRNDPKDIEYTVTFNGNKLEYIKNKDAEYTLVLDKDYTINGNKVAVKVDYLSQLPKSGSGVNTELIFHFNRGRESRSTIWVNSVASEITTKSASFDKENPKDIEITGDFKGNKLVSVTLDKNSLMEKRDYTISKNKLILTKKFLKSRENNVYTLELAFDNSYVQPQVKITVTGSVKNASIDVDSLKFFKNKPKNIEVELKLNGNEIQEIIDGKNVLKKDIDYILTGSKLSISSEYLTRQPEGVSTLEISFDKGKDLQLIIEVYEVEILNSVISSKGFKLRHDNVSDIVVEIKLNGNILESIKNENKILEIDKDYVVTGEKVTIKKEYLLKLKSGETKLIFCFSKGKPAKLTIQLLDEAAIVTPEIEYFYKANPEDKSFKIELNGNVIKDISYEGKKLKMNEEYQIEGDRLTIKKAFLYELKEGRARFVISFEKGRECKFSINILNYNKFLIVGNIGQKEVKAGEDATFNFEVTNCTKNVENAVVIIALYDKDNKQITYGAVSQTINPYEVVKLTEVISIPEKGEYTIKCFVCDSLKDKKPISEITEIKVK